MASLDTAIRLVTQAVGQDEAKNYDEAARCYREALIAFRTVTRSKNVSARVSRLIEDKCRAYESRLRKLECYLLNQADFSHLFRECVRYNQEQEELRQNRHKPLTACKSGSSTCSSSSDYSDRKEFYENPFLKKGLDTIRRAKREDCKAHFPEALHLYERGTALLFDALKQGLVSERQTDLVRVKCLLILDRAEIIKNHLERGDPIRLRKSALDSLEYSLEASPSSMSPLPTAETESALDEQRTLQMEEVRSERSMAGSTHSLYPAVCVQPSKFDDGHRNSASSPLLHVQPDEIIPIPLVDTDQELKVSAASRISEKGEDEEQPLLAQDDQGSVGQSHSSLGSSLDHIPSHLEEDEEDEEPDSASRRVAHLLNADQNSILMLDSTVERDIEEAPPAAASLEQLDRQVSEVTYVNAEVYKELMQGSSPRETGSDSGFSDPSSPERAKASPASDRKSPLSDIDSLDIVPSLPQPSPSPEQQRQKAQPSPTPSNSSSLASSRGRRRSRHPSSNGSSVKIDPSDAGVTVLSEETVVDGRVREPETKPRSKSEVYVKPPPEVYTKAGSLRRAEYIPPRAMARRPAQEDEEDVNKGCYYFMACLDSFWIL